MAEKDFSGLVAEKAAARVKQILALVRERVSVGPGKEILSPQETMQRLAAMTPEQRMAFINEIGIDTFLNEVTKFNGNG